MATEQDIIAKMYYCFKDCTVITIAHRLITVAHYDVIMVMDQGKIVEMDHPFRLLTLKPTDQYITNPSLYASMVRKSGDGMARMIFNVAKDRYFKAMAPDDSTSPIKM
jgi:ATP-binding cassette subfamily C (CFTR/MRP) protein 4